MTIYILFYLLLVVGSFTKNYYFNKTVQYIIIPCFICFGYMIGSDWRGYELAFGDFDYLQNWDKEKGYFYLGYILGCLGFSFWQFSILLKLVGYYIFLYFYKKYTDNDVICLNFVFVFYMLTMWMDHPARNFCAVLIYLFAIRFLYERKIIPYIILCLIASYFHLSVLALIPVYFLYRRYSKRILINVMIISFVIFLFGVTLFRNVFFQIIALSEVFESRMELYDDIGVTPIKLIINLGFHSLIMFLIVLNKEVIESKYKYGYFMIFLTVVYFVFSVIGVLIPILFRLKLYIAIAYFVSIVYLLRTCFSLKKSTVRALIFVIPLFVLVNNIRIDKYVPYSSYLQYTFREKPSYYYRSNYNWQNSPYRGKINAY